MKQILAFIFHFLLCLSLCGQEHLIDSLFNAKYKPDENGAVVLVSKKGTVTSHKAYGMANLELNVVMRPEMVFEIGSMTKQFTATAILQLAEAGKLSLKDPLSKFIQGYPKGDLITIHHLLNHTSGIKDPSFTEWIAFYKSMNFDPLDFIKRLEKDSLAFAPGEKWEYSNSGYFILGYIIEKVSGQSYPDYIQKNIFDVVGMKNSYCQVGNIHELVKNRADGYARDKNIYHAEYHDMVQPYAAGCILSNVEDLAKWNYALHANKLLKAETTALLFNSYKLSTNSKTGYGYGFFIRDINGKTTFEHGGGIPGYSSHGLYLPQEDIYIVALSNCKQIDPANEVAMIAMALTGRPFSNKPVISLDQKTREKYLGSYVNKESGATLTIFEEEGMLYTRRKGTQARIKLAAFAADKFYVPNEFTEYEFTKDVKGNITGLKHKTRFRENILVKN